MSNKQSIGRIASKTANRSRSKFPLSADTYTSCGFGEVTPVLFQKCEHNTQNEVSHDCLVRLAPLLAPTRTKVGVRLTTKFVGMSELTENYGFLMADKPVSRADKVFVPKNLPHIPWNVLSSMVMIGSSVTLYMFSNANDDYEPTCDSRLYRAHHDLTNLSSGFVSLSKVLCDTDDTSAASLNDNILFTTSPSENIRAPFDVGENRPFLNFGRLFGLDSELWLPIAGANSFATLFDMGQGSGDNLEYTREVTLEGADFVIVNKITRGDSSRLVAAAIRLSSFGQRLRKAIIGVGEELNFYSSAPKTMMPLFALYKAWYDSYAPQLYENWTKTAAYRLLFAYEKDNASDFSDYLDNSQTFGYPQLMEFFLDLGNLWYTEEQDIVTAHIRELAVSSGGVLENSIPGWPNIPNGPRGDSSVQDNFDSSVEPVSPAPSGVPFMMDGRTFTQLDLELMQKAYQSVNRNTIAGQRIAEVLRMNGLGKWMDECKSHFVGESYVPVDINDVTATSDSYNNATSQGSTIGDYVGKGVGYDSGKMFVYENDEYGYLITLAVVIPEGGYVQQEAPWMNCIKRADFYLPDYDGKGYEANPKTILCAQQDFTDYSERDELEKNFGFAPRETRHKMSIGRLNGNFSLRSERELPLSYSLDKFINIGERNIGKETDMEDYTMQLVSKGFRASMIPCATPNLRYIGRMKWLGNYDRIFNLEGRPSPWSYNNLNLSEGSTDGLFVWFELTHRGYDNFLLFVNNNLVQRSPMLPFEDSFETKDDGADGITDISVGKA